MVDKKKTTPKGKSKADSELDESRSIEKLISFHTSLNKINDSDLVSAKSKMNLMNQNVDKMNLLTKKISKNTDKNNEAIKEVADVIQVVTDLKVKDLLTAKTKMMLMSNTLTIIGELGENIEEDKADKIIKVSDTIRSVTDLKVKDLLSAKTKMMLMGRTLKRMEELGNDIGQKEKGIDKIIKVSGAIKSITDLKVKDLLTVKTKMMLMGRTLKSMKKLAKKIGPGTAGEKRAEKITKLSDTIKGISDLKIKDLLLFKLKMSLMGLTLKKMKKVAKNIGEDGLEAADQITTITNAIKGVSELKIKDIIAFKIKSRFLKVIGFGGDSTTKDGGIGKSDKSTIMIKLDILKSKIFENNLILEEIRRALRIQGPDGEPTEVKAIKKPKELGLLATLLAGAGALLMMFLQTKAGKFILGFLKFLISPIKSTIGFFTNLVKKLWTALDEKVIKPLKKIIFDFANKFLIQPLKAFWEGTIKPFRDKIIGFVKKYITQPLKDFANTIVAKITGIKNSLIKGITKVKDIVINGIKTFFTSMWEKILGFLNKFGITGLLKKGAGFLKSAFGYAAEKVSQAKGVIGKGVDVVKGVAKTGYAAAKGVVGKVVAAFPSKKVIGNTIQKLGSGVIKKVLTKIPIIGTAVSGGILGYEALVMNENIKAGGSPREALIAAIPTAGALIGGGLGAAIGSILPGFGTLLGGVGGAVLGDYLAASFAPEIADLVGKIWPMFTKEGSAKMVAEFKENKARKAGVPITKLGPTDRTPAPKADVIGVDNIAEKTRTMSNVSPAREAAAISREQKTVNESLNFPQAPIVQQRNTPVAVPEGPRNTVFQSKPNNFSTQAFLFNNLMGT